MFLQRCRTPFFATPPSPLLSAAAAPLSGKAAPSVDTIPALIEAHKRAYTEFIAVLDDLAVAEQAAWHGAARKTPRRQRRAEASACGRAPFRRP